MVLGALEKRWRHYRRFDQQNECVSLLLVSSILTSEVEDHSGDPDLANIFNNEVKNVFNTIKGFITGQNDGIRNAFTAGNLKTIGDVMKNVSIEGLISVLEVLRIAVKAIVRFLAKLIVFFKDFGNWK